MIKFNISQDAFIRAVVIIFFISAINKLHAQERHVDYFLKTQSMVSTSKNIPFWMHSNRDGIIDQESANLYQEAGFRSLLYNSNNNQFKVNAGANIIGRISTNSDIYFSQLFLKASFKKFQLDIGKPIGLNNHDISLGSMIMSRNADPLVRIGISMPEFANVPFTKGAVQYKGLLNHGWMEDDRDVSDIRLHQKNLYLKFNINKFSIIPGFNHHVMWAGKSERFGKLPSSFSDFTRVLVGLGASEDSDAPGGEKSNVIGNSIASYDIGVSYEFEKIDVLLTRVFYLEDKVSTRIRSPWDGIWGVNISFNNRRGLIKSFVYQHMNTKQQDAKEGQALGRASIFNHFIYTDGWTSDKRALSNPLIRFNEDRDFIDNNIVIGHHVGFTGAFTNQIRYKILTTYSRNYGILRDRDIEPPINRFGDNNKDEFLPLSQFRQDLFSFLFNIEYDIPQFEHLELNVGISSDVGEFANNNIGFMLGIKWNNSLDF